MVLLFQELQVRITGRPRIQWVQLEHEGGTGMITLDLARERRLELRREARRSQSRLTDRARILATRLAR